MEYNFNKNELLRAENFLKLNQEFMKIRCFHSQK